jgi:predicted amidohydrolase
MTIDGGWRTLGSGSFKAAAAFALFLVAGPAPAVAGAPADGPTPATANGAPAARYSPPRKVLIGTEVSGYDVILNFSLEQRFERMEELLNSMDGEAKLYYPGKRLDLAILTEYFFGKPGKTLAETAVRLDDVKGRISACARAHGCYLVAPMILREEGEPARYANAAFVFDRNGEIVGAYRKVHPCSDLKFEDLEGGMTPGQSFPVFTCDFGRLGIEICYDVMFPDGWAALAKEGAEIVALPSETPETIRPSAYAEQHRYYIASAVPRDHAAIYNPLGVVEAQATHAGVLVHQIDLSFAITGWLPGLDEGRAVTRKFGDKAGYNYYFDQDTGIFWSNDPSTPIGTMMDSLGFPDVDQQTERVRLMQEKLRGGPPAGS